MSIEATPHAIYDIDTAAEYLELEKVGGGTRFGDDLERLLTRLERFPESAEPLDPPSTRYPAVRRAQLATFAHYAVFYQQTPVGILVFRVLHTSRDTSLIFYPEPDPPATPS